MTSCRPLQQSPAFARALHQIGCDVGLRDGHVLLRRHLAGVGLTMLSRVDLRGPELPATLPSGALLIAPDRPVPWMFASGAVPLMTPATVAELDLTLPPEQLLSGQHQKWRNRLRHAQKQPLRVHHSPMPNDSTHWLYAADIKSQKRKHYRSWPSSLTQAFVAHDRDQSRLFTAHLGHNRVAAMLFLRHGASASYHIGATTTKGRQHSAHNLLLWQAALWLRSQGHARLDLGLVETQRAPGLARFKLGSGARARPLGGTWLRLPGLTMPGRMLARWDRALFSRSNDTLPP